MEEEKAKEDDGSEDDSLFLDDSINRKKKKRGKSSRAIEGMPLYLTSMISALTNNDHDDVHTERYENADSVLADLIVASNKFDIYLGRQFDREDASLLNHLPIPRSAFYGRQSELSILKSSLHSVMDFGKPMMTMVSGHAG
jgi:hypothetical protein